MPRSCQSLNPPSNALLLFSNRPLCGLPNLSALPLPSTTYSGSSTAIRRFSALAAKAAVEQIGANENPSRRRARAPFNSR